MWSWICDRCRLPRVLFLRLGDENVCGPCWVRAGRPSPAVTPPDPAHEVAVRERMLARGGADAYRVKAGKA